MKAYNEELYHYGVIGMKWGVRKNPTKAYVKATKKQNRLDRRVHNAKLFKSELDKDLSEATSDLAWVRDKVEVSKAKLGMASREYRNKKESYEKHKDSDFLGFRKDALNRAESNFRDRSTEYNDYREKLDRAVLNVDQAKESVYRQSMRVKRAITKSERWRKAMDQTFADVSEEYITAGKEILERSKKR